MRNTTMWSYFLSSACGDMPNTQNVPYRARSGCLGGGGSEGGAPIRKGQSCVVVGKWGLSRFTIEPLGLSFLQKRGQGRSRLQERGQLCKNEPPGWSPVLWLASGGSQVANVRAGGGRVSRLNPWGGRPCKNEGGGGHVCKNVVSFARTSPLGGRACRDKSRGGWRSRQCAGGELMLAK